MLLRFILALTTIKIQLFVITQATITSHNVSDRNYVFGKYPYNEIISNVVNSTTEQVMEFYEESDEWCGYPTRVHLSTNDTLHTPLFITAVQQSSVWAWQLPLVIKTENQQVVFDDFARTLCPKDDENKTCENRPRLQVSTSSVQNISIDVKLRRVKDFFVKLDSEVPLTLSPSTPKYYRFLFHQQQPNSTSLELLRFNYTSPESVVLTVESEDQLCAIVSVQDNSCPIYDTEQDVLYQGYHFTMTTKGGITLTQSMFPNGFYVVFIVKQSDDECTGASEMDVESGYWSASGERMITSVDRIKNIRFNVSRTISYGQYLVGAVVMLCTVAAVALVVALSSLRCHCHGSQVLIEAEESGSETAIVEESRPILTPQNSNDSLEESRVHTTPGSGLTLAELCKAQPEAHSRRTNRYCWSSITIGAVYALPVVQLLVNYQHMVLETGNQDLCYYNFLCAHPLGFLSDFNHVYSNVSYILLGLAFIAQVRARQKAQISQDLGIPAHHGLCHAMGVALCMEGLLSACYHLCPNKMNFQFDSSWMYVTAGLVMVKLYQSRHPDLNASAQVTFLLLAAIMALGVFGIMYPSVYLWVFLTILHIGVCFVLTLKIYYLGKFPIGRGTLPAMVAALRSQGRTAFVPEHTARAVLLAITNFANIALAAYGIYEHNKDLARHILAILMGNAILYTLFYIIMKLIYREKILIRTWLYFLFAGLCWGVASKLFLHSTTKWSETPASSRRHNAPCLVLNLYDSHDLWHLLSAIAIYLSFNVLLTADDPLATTPRHLIPVF